MAKKIEAAKPRKAKAGTKKASAKGTLVRRGGASTGAKPASKKSTASSNPKESRTVRRPARTSRATRVPAVRASKAKPGTKQASKVKPGAVSKTKGGAEARKSALAKRSVKAAPSKPIEKATERRTREAGPKASEKISKAVKKLMALKAEKARSPRRDGYLIKAPKKTNKDERVGPIRFARKPTLVIMDATVTKNNTPKKKTILRKKDVEDLKLALQEERKRLIGHLARLDEQASLSGPSEVNQDVPGYSIHLAEYASDNQIVETSLAQRALQAERLSEIEQALQRINQPGYGVCQNCLTPINIDRLKIKPFAIYCTRCRELKEQGRL